MSTTTPSSAPPARLAAWTSRLGNITDEVQSLIHDRDTWHTISEIGAANPTVVANPFVMGHFNTLYYRRALVSVRAMVDPNNDSDSLLTLLTDIAAHPGDLEVTDSEMRLPGSDTIDPDKVRADIERLKTVAATTKKYVNKCIAHIDSRGTPTVPTAPEIDAAVELIGELLHKYTLLLTGADLRLGILVAFDWTSVFTVPWIIRPRYSSTVRCGAGRASDGHAAREASSAFGHIAHAFLKVTSERRWAEPKLLA